MLSHKELKERALKRVDVKSERKYARALGCSLDLRLVKDSAKAKMHSRTGSST